jgi:hypothetical protein
MKWKYRAAAIVLAFAACTAPNPNFAGGSGDGGASDGSVDGSSADGLSPVDMTAVCMPKQRTCLAQTGSALCEAGQFKLDRKCPNLSTCTTGYCQPPPVSSTSLVGASCDPAGAPQENVCFSTTGDVLSCEPFVDPNTKKIGWFCDKAVGMGLPGTTCATGDDCRSGFCGSNGTCFRSCLDQTDCPLMGNTGQPYRCATVAIVVEGEQVSAKSCIP